MKQRLIGLILLATFYASVGHATEGQDLDLDISGITAVAIGGEASSVMITTAPDAPYRGTVRRHRSGWLWEWSSGWAFDDCSGSSHMWIEGTLLRIDVGISRWFGRSDCSYDINLNIKKQTAVAIDQQALQASLSGDFSTLTIAAKAGDIGISGRADTIALRGDALRVNLVLKPMIDNEVVAIDARMLEADLDFSAAPQLAYSITAKASLISSARKSVPGAKPTLTIAGDLVHATIR
jgi:hypothetical protein